MKTMERATWIAAIVLMALCLVHLPACRGSEGAATGRAQGRHEAVFEDNEIFQNDLVGIRVAGDLPVHIRDNDVHLNGRAGIILGWGARARITGTRIHDNHDSGLRIGGTGCVDITGCRVFANLRSGLLIDPLERGFRGRIRLMVSDSRIYANQRAGIRSRVGPDTMALLSVAGCSIYRNLDAGIRVRNHTHLTVSGCWIRRNGMAGIISLASPNDPVLDIVNNKICFNLGPGILVVQGRSGEAGIKGNWIYNNLRSGVVCGLWKGHDYKVGGLSIAGNIIVSNGSGDKGAGIRWTGKGRVSVRKNVIAYNVSTGIRSKGCKGYAGNLLFANGKAARCCEDPDTAPFMVESIQYSGCAGRGKGDIITDPRFLDPDAYDFRLEEGSPARGILYGK